MRWLRKIREAESKSQQECAEAIGVTQQAYHNYETGCRKVSPDKARQIAEVLRFDKYGLTWHEAFFREAHPAAPCKSAGRGVGG